MNELQQSCLDKIKIIIKIFLDKNEILGNDKKIFGFDRHAPSNSIRLLNGLYGFTLHIFLENDTLRIINSQSCCYSISEKWLMKSLERDFEFDLPELLVYLDDLIINNV